MIDEKQRAFMQAYDPCQEAFSRYCTALTYGKMNAEDLMQDILLSAYERFDSISQKGQLLHYLIRAARNRSISHWRRSRFQGEYSEIQAAQLKAQGVSPGTLIDVEYLYRLLDRLPRHQKEALILHEICGFKVKEIAQIQAVEEGAVKNRLSRGRRKLKSLHSEKSRLPWILGLLLLRPTSQVSTPASGSFAQTILGWKEVIQGLAPKSSFSLTSLGSSGAIWTSLSLAGLSAKAWLVAASIGVVVLTGGYFIQEATIQEKARANTSIETDAISPATLGFNTPHKVNQSDGERASLDQNQSNPDSPEPLKTKKKLLADDFNEFKWKPNAPQIKSLPQLSEEKNEEIIRNCAKVKFEGNIQQFKRKLIERLLFDKAISAKGVEIELWFEPKGILINGAKLDIAQMENYLVLFNNYNIKPCENRLVHITEKYIAIGDIVEEKVDGELERRFQGRVNGAVDLDDLNNIEKSKSRGDNRNYFSKPDKKNNKKINNEFADKGKEFEEREIGAFHSVRVSGMAAVHLSRGKSRKAQIYGSEMPNQKVTTEVINGVLHIGTVGKRPAKNIRVEVQAPKMKSIWVGGTSELYSNDPIQGEDLAITVADVGSAWLEVDAQNLKIKMEGGDLDIKGKAQSQDIRHGKNAHRSTLKQNGLIIGR